MERAQGQWGGRTTVRKERLRNPRCISFQRKSGDVARGVNRASENHNEGAGGRDWAQERGQASRPAGQAGPGGSEQRARRPVERRLPGPRCVLQSRLPAIPGAPCPGGPRKRRRLDVTRATSTRGGGGRGVASAAAAVGQGARPGLSTQQSECSLARKGIHFGHVSTQALF